MADQVRQSSFRVAIYKTIEEIAGRNITPEEHDKLKELLLNYVKSHTDNFDALSKTVQTQGQKINRMAKICYQKGKVDAEMLEKDILFLKELFTTNA